MSNNAGAENLFVKRFKKIRKARGLTQVQVAADLNISKGAVAMWETGKRTPPLKTLQQLAEYLDCRLDYLLGTSDDAGTTNTEYQKMRSLANSIYSAEMAVKEADALQELFFRIAALDEYGRQAVRALVFAENSRCADQSNRDDDVSSYMTITVSIDHRKAPYTVPASQAEEYYNYAAGEIKSENDDNLVPEE